MLLTLTLAALLLPTRGSATPEDARELPPIQAGTLRLRAAGGAADLDLAAVSSDVAIRASGIVARATLRQVFRNPSAEWREGVYMFPLPEGAAVDHLHVEAGDRIIEGEIMERDEARRTYEDARANGQRAALLEQARPNLFTTSVANIAPLEDVTVVIEYQQTLRLDGDAVRLRFPMAVTPRFAAASQGGAVAGEPEPDVQPPFARADEGGAGGVSLRVEIDAGAAIDAVTSASHAIRVVEDGATRRVVELDSPQAPVRDFELEWTLAPRKAPAVAFFVEPHGDVTHGLLMVMPPSATGLVRLQREVVFVIDSSGSMAGPSIEQARRALALAIERLESDALFNVIDFDSTATSLWPEARQATAASRSEAEAWVGALQADGGTNIASALELALDGASNPDRLRQVVFLTDGAIDDEAGLFDLIAKRLGDSRLFTIGIGPAPNAWFMTKAAESGRGTYTFIGRVEDVEERMKDLLAKLETPVMSDIAIEWPDGAHAEAWPALLPDLYAGEPVVVSVALPKAAGVVRVSGRRDGSEWSQQIDLGRAIKGSGIGVLWARAKIDALLDGLHRGAAEADVRSAVVDVALEHHLVSRYTSLVAIDASPARPEGEPVVTRAVPTPLPQGFTGVVASLLPRSGTGFRFDVIAGMVLTLVAMLIGWHHRPERA
jgi:Ca-activated chloride channel family protein